MTAQAAEACCELLPWDSEFFGCRIARLTPARLTDELVHDAVAWCGRQRIACLYFLADADDPRTALLAQAGGFVLVDVRVTLDAQPSGVVSRAPVDGVLVRAASPGDIDQLRNVARQSHHDTRFYFDPHFPTERCDALYETWIEKSVHGSAQIVLVLEVRGAVAGYVSCHNAGDGRGQIGLLGLAPDAQHQGHGERLLHDALRWYAEHSVTEVQVVTQGRNVRAQRLYQRCGFRTRLVQIWYHRWFDAPSALDRSRQSS